MGVLGFVSRPTRLWVTLATEIVIAALLTGVPRSDHWLAAIVALVWAEIGVEIAEIIQMLQGIDIRKIDIVRIKFQNAMEKFNSTIMLRIVPELDCRNEWVNMVVVKGSAETREELDPF